MDNASSLFDVQKLGTEQLSKTSNNVTSLQKSLRKLYVNYQKNIATNPPLPYLKIIAGSQGIAFSPQALAPLTFPANTMPQIESHHPKDSIVLSVALQFSFMPIDAKGKKFKGAFITLDKEERLRQGKEYSSLYTNLDDKELFMIQMNHPALFVCTTKAKTSNKLDAHIFVCLSEEQALDIVKAFKGQLTIPVPTAAIPAGIIQPGENYNNFTDSANPANNDQMRPENQVPGQNELYSMQSYGQQQQRNPQQVHVQTGSQEQGGFYEQVPAIQQLQISNHPVTVTSTNQCSSQLPITTSNFQPYNQPFHVQYPTNPAYFSPSGAPPSSTSSNVSNFYNSFNAPIATPGTQQVMDLNGHGPPATASNSADILHIPRPTISTNNCTQPANISTNSVPPLYPQMNQLQQQPQQQQPQQPQQQQPQQIPIGFQHQGHLQNIAPSPHMISGQPMLQSPAINNTQMLPVESLTQHQQVVSNLNLQQPQNQPALFFQQQPPSAPIVVDSTTTAFHTQDQLPVGKIEPKLPPVPAKPDGGRKLVVPKRVVGVPVFPVAGGLNMDLLKKRKSPLVSSTSSEGHSEVFSPQPIEHDDISNPSLTKSSESGPDSSGIEKTDFEKSLGYFP